MQAFVWNTLKSSLFQQKATTALVEIHASLSYKSSETRSLAVLLVISTIKPESYQEDGSLQGS